VRAKTFRVSAVTNDVLDFTSGRSYLSIET